MKTLRISHVTNKNFSFNDKYYVVEEKKMFLKFFSYWKECKYLSGDLRDEESCYVPYTFNSVEKAKAFIKEKYKIFFLCEKIVYRVIPDGMDDC